MSCLPAGFLTFFVFTVCAAKCLVFEPVVLTFSLPAYGAFVCSLSGINVLPRFEWQTAIIQSAHADKLHYSFDGQFYLIVQDHFLLVNFHSLKVPGWLYTSDRGECSKHVGSTTFLFDLMSVDRALSLLVLLISPKCCASFVVCIIYIGIVTGCLFHKTSCCWQKQFMHLGQIISCLTICVHVFACTHERCVLLSETESVCFHIVMIFSLHCVALRSIFKTKHKRSISRMYILEWIMHTHHATF